MKRLLLFLVCLLCLPVLAQPGFTPMPAVTTVRVEPTIWDGDPLHPIFWPESTITWDPYPSTDEPGFAGFAIYRVAHDFTAPLPPGSEVFYVSPYATSVVLPIAPNTLYRAVVVPYDLWGVEGEVSEEAVWLTEMDPNALPVPFDFRVVTSADYTRSTLNWSYFQDTTVTGFRIYLYTGTNAVPSVHTAVGATKTSYVLSTVPNTHYSAVLLAYNDFGIQSESTQAVVWFTGKARPAPPYHLRIMAPTPQ